MGIEGYHLVVSGGSPTKLSAMVYLDQGDAALLIEFPTIVVENEAEIEAALIALFRRARIAGTRGGIPEAETTILSAKDLSNVVPIRRT